MTLSIKVLYGVWLSIMLWMMWWLTAFWASKWEMETLVRQVASDYREKNDFQWQCSIDWAHVSLGAYLYAKMLQEWGYKDGKLGDRTNNRWSLHFKQWLFPIKKSIYADGTKWPTRPVYEKPYDWLYELTHLIVTDKKYKKCNMDYSTVKSFISWPNAPDSKRHPERCIGKKCNLTIKEFAGYKLKQNKAQALLFDKTKDQISDKPTTQKMKKETGYDITTKEKKCKVLDRTEYDRVQIDVMDKRTGVAELLDQVVSQGTWTVLVLSKCNVVK